jgi:restriction system protein
MANLGYFFGCSGTLKNLQVDDINTPINEISKYLIAKYETRFSVNPRLFEEVVANVFKALGYHAHVTGYGNDGGIDVVLGKANDNMIGIQVKRYKNKIKVEQIRAFAGALILSGLKKGIFVTTSDFQPAAYFAAKQLSSKALPVELINADKFYDALKISQKTQINIEEIKESIKKEYLPNLYPYGWDTPRNSL